MIDGRFLAFAGLVALLALGAVGNADLAEQYHIEGDKKAQRAFIEAHQTGLAVADTVRCLGQSQPKE